MSLQNTPSLTGPEIPASERAASSGSTRSAVGFLLARGADPRRESRRIAIGLLSIAVLSVLLLNVGVYQSAQIRLTEVGWQALTAQTEHKREEILAVLDGFKNEVRYLAGQPSIDEWTARAADGELSAEDRAAFVSTLERFSAEFGHLDAALFSTSGKPLVVSTTGFAVNSGRIGEIVTPVMIDRKPHFGEIHEHDTGARELAVAVPVYRPHGNSILGVLVCRALVDELFAPVLTRWVGFDESAGAYLVSREGARFVYLSAPPGPDARKLGTHALPGDPRLRAPAMAVVGVETNAETEASDGRKIWAVTRQIPDLGWGLVGQVDRDAMMAGMRGSLYGLLLLDLGMAFLAVAAIWFWKRQYASGLARREIEITRRHAERVQSLFDNAFDAIITFGKDNRIRTVNRAAEELFCRSASEMHNQQIHHFLREGAVDPGAAEGVSCLTPGVVRRSEVLREDGTIVPVEYSLGRSGRDEALVFTAILRDVSDQVEAQQRIQNIAEGLKISNQRLEEMNAQLEEASRLKSEFLANTSHELRTPLNGMIGFLQLVLDGMCDSRDEERDYLKQALQCSRHLLGLINDVLDIAKIEAGKLNLDIDRVDVRTLFDEVYTVTHVQAAQKGIALECDAPDDDAIGIRADFGKVKQVLINLVGNSLKFTPYGRITVRASMHDDLGHCMFEVVDTGIGIPEDRQKLIFEKFTQGDGSTTRRFGGTGLGLAISRSLVELMGGIIGVQSEGEGKGTRMYFSLPLWRGEEPHHEDLSHDHDDTIAGPARGSVALIVEDDPTFRKFIAAVLNQRGYRTLEARNADSGWLLVRRMKPAVVILDYALTSAEGAQLRTGWDLAERMASDEDTRHIPLVFVTGFDGEVRERLRSTAFARRPEHMVKPIDGQALIRKIEALVGETESGPVRVLMADDDPSVAAFVHKVLPDSRYLVEIASNGEECLHILRKQPRGFDILLLDLMMPEVSGYDVLREMTLSGMNPDLPVLVLTNYPEPRNEEERLLLEEGLVFDVVPKSRIHDDPQLLPHVIEWHLQAAFQDTPQPKRGAGATNDEPRREAA